MNKKKKPTIYEVAQEAGVSRQTVSRVLNNRPDVSAETRQRVKEIIKQLEYQPSAIARSLSLRKSSTLGVVTAGLKHIGPSRILSGITREADRLGYGLLLKELYSLKACDVFPFLQWFQAQQVEGIIWAVPQIGENRQWLKELQDEIRIPMTFLTMQERENLSIVRIDNYQGGRLAVQHLIDLDSRRIGHISGPLDWWEARERKRAWEDVLLENGMDVEKKMWAEGNWSSKSGKTASHELLINFPEVDAVFAANDQMALSFMQTAAAFGRKIPNDLIVIGFDGLPESGYFSPPLSTIDQNLDEIGCSAVQELIRMMDMTQENKTNVEPKMITLNPKLIIRRSTTKI